jgi:hypothetical protein
MSVIVSIKDLSVSMALGNNGVVLDVYDHAGNHLGELRLGKATVEWGKGRTRAGYGTKVQWTELIAWFESQAD